MASSPVAAVFVGVATFDAIALVDRLPGADERVVAEAVSFAGGGPAATAAVTAARLGVAAAFVGAVGDDEDGRRIVAGLADEGVDVSGVEVVPGQASGVSVIVVDRVAGTRTICTRPQTPLEVRPGSAGARLVEGAGWVHVDHLGWGAVRRLLGPPSPGGPRWSVDGGNPIEGFTPAGVDLYVPTLAQLSRLHGTDDLDALLDAALAAGAGTVVATRGADGCVAATADGRRHTAPGVSTSVLSTLGAGDVFHGALLAAVVEGLPLDEALLLANSTAALSCGGLDGRSAVPRREELEHLLPAPAR